MFLYAAMGYVEVAMVSSSLCLFLMVFIFKDVAVGQFGLYNHRYIFFVEVALLFGSCLANDVRYDGINFNGYVAILVGFYVEGRAVGKIFLDKVMEIVKVLV